MLQCPSCDSWNDDSAAFCGQCGGTLGERDARPRGARQGGAPSRPSGEGQRPRARAVVGFVAAASAVLLVVVAVLLDFDGDRGSAPESGRGDTASPAAPAVASPIEHPRPPRESDEALPERVSPADARRALLRAMVSFELLDRDGDALERSGHGVLVAPRGVVLARLSDLLGAVAGGVRVGGARETVEIIGAIQVDAVRDLVLLALDGGRGAGVDGELRVFPSLQPLARDDAWEFLVPGVEILVASVNDIGAAAVSESPFYDAAGTRCLRLGPSQDLPRLPLFALDEYGFLVGFARPSPPDLEGQPSRVLVDPVGTLEEALDGEPRVTLARLTSQFWDGSFDDFLAAAKKALKRRDAAAAIELLFQALERTEQAAVESSVEEAMALLARVLGELRAELERQAAWPQLADLLARAHGFLAEDRDILVALSAVRLRLGQFAEALEAGWKAHALRADTDVEALLQESYLGLAAQLAAASDLNGAAETLLEGVTHLPRSGKLHLELARIYQSWESWEDAARVYRVAAELDPRLSGEVALRLESIDEAIKRREAIVLPKPPGSAMYETWALVNGAGNYRFLVDTGASHTAITVTMADALGINWRAAPRATVGTAGGAKVVPVVTLSSLSIQGYAVNDLKAFVLLEHRGDVGLIGLNFLNHFKTTFDAARGELMLQRR